MRAQKSLREVSRIANLSQALIDDGALVTLCKLAHSANPRVQTGALWATKHLVSQTPSAIKQSCLEELGIAWLLGVIEGNNVFTTSQSANAGVPPHLSINAASNAMGERVSIFHTPDDDEQMSDEPSQPSMSLDPATSLAKDASGSADGQISGVESRFSQPIDPQHRQYLDNIKAAEESEKARRPMQDLNQIQAHALDVLRNVLCGPGEPAMIDYVLNTIGRGKLYSILASKMQPSTVGSQNVNDLPLRTLDAALKTLCHIAAGPPKDRADVVAQEPLLQLLHPLFHHHDPDIRSTCCWILTNLMWLDDNSDVQHAKQRASTLKRMGFERPLAELSRRLSDGGQEQSHDVRERAGAARDCMIQVTEGRSSRMSEPTGLGHGVGLRAS